LVFTVAFLVYILFYRAIQGREEELCFTLQPKKSQHDGAKSVFDLEFADEKNVVLLSNNIEKSKNLIHRVESRMFESGSAINVSKTKAMFFNTNVQPFQSMEWSEINQTLAETGEQDIKYLGSWCS